MINDVLEKKIHVDFRASVSLSLLSDFEKKSVCFLKDNFKCAVHSNLL